MTSGVAEREQVAVTTGGRHRARGTAPDTRGDRSHYQVTFVVLLLGISTFSLLQSMVSPVLSTIQHTLHTSQDTVTWVLTAYLVSASVATPILGRIGDMVGKKRMLVVTLLVLAAGSLLAALATSIGVLIIARVVQGVAGAVLPLSFGIIRDEFPKEKVTSAIGIAAAMLAVGGGIGIVLAGPIVEGLGYHWLFWIPLVMVLVSAAAAAVVVPESRSRSRGRVSWGAALLLSGWLVALLVAVSEGQTWGWTSGRTLGLVALAVVLAALWVVVELRSAQPLIDMRMMRIPAVWTTNVVALMFGVGMYCMFAFLPELLQTPRSAGYGFSASITASGLYLVPMTVTMFTFGVLSGPLAARVGSKWLLLAGCLTSVAPSLMIAEAHSQSWEIYLASALVGIGMGLGFAAMSNIIVESVPMSQTGVASGMNANIRTIGGAVGAAVMASIVTSRPQAGGVPREAGYTNGFLFLTVVALLATAAAVAIPRRRREPQTLAQSHTVRHGETALVAAAPLVDAD